jgi:N utilization substance protein B
MTPSSNPVPSSRHRAREVALQALYALDLQRQRSRAGAGAEAEAKAEDGEGADAEDAPVLKTGREAFEGVADHFEMPAAARDFARELVIAVSDNGVDLDGVLAEHAKNWRVSRMAIVDRNILRLAIFELTQSDTPVAIVLDEAVELARRYGSDASPAFVNGVLDAVAKQVRGKEAR